MKATQREKIGYFERGLNIIYLTSPFVLAYFYFTNY